MTLRLLVDLYYVQNLRNDGGVSRKLMYQQYERIEVGHQAQFTIWAFRYKTDRYMVWANELPLPREADRAGKGAG